MDPAFFLDKAITAALTVGAAWLGVRIELRLIWKVLDTLQRDLETERKRINRLTERFHHEPIAPPRAARRH